VERDKGKGRKREGRGETEREREKLEKLKWGLRKPIPDGNRKRSVLGYFVSHGSI
jgi:hypothetical protein